MNDESSIEKTATWLTGGFATLTAALGAFGASQGTIQRMLVDNPVQSRRIFVLAGLSIPFAGAAGILAGPRIRRFLLIASLVFFSAALTWGIAVAGDLPSTQSQPSITASLKVAETGGLVLEARVTADGLSAGSGVRVVVEGLGGAGQEPTRLYDAEVGRSLDSTSLDVTFQIPLLPGQFKRVGLSAGRPAATDSCFDAEGSDKGCVLVRIPRRLSTDTHGGSKEVV